MYHTPPPSAPKVQTAVSPPPGLEAQLADQGPQAPDPGLGEGHARRQAEAAARSQRSTSVDAGVDSGNDGAQALDMTTECVPMLICIAHGPTGRGQHVSTGGTGSPGRSQG